MSNRLQLEGGRPLESRFGYCRVIRIDNPKSHIFIAGNASTGIDGSVRSPGDYYSQTKYILEELIGGYLGEIGASFVDVVRTRIYVVDLARHWEEVGKAHGEVFGRIKPVVTMIGINALVHPDMVVEIDADAVI